MRSKYAFLFFVIFSIVFAFNEMLNIYMSKFLVRGIYIAFLMFCLIYNFACKKSKSTIRKMDLLVSLYILFIIVRVAVQIIVNENTSVTIIAFFQMIIPIFAYYVSQELEDEQCRKIEGFVGVCAAVSVVLGIMDARMNFLPDKGAFANSLYAGIGSGRVVLRGYSMAGSALTTGFMCVVALWFLIHNQNDSFLPKIILNVLVFIVLLGLGLSLSRGAYAALIIACVIYIVLTTQQGINKRKFSVFIVSVYLLALLFILNYKAVLASSVFQRIFNAGLSLSEGSNIKRMEWQVIAFKSFIEKPIVGRGLGICGYQANINKVPGSINTESYFLSILIGLGLVGFIMFLGIIIKSFKGWKMYSKNFGYCSLIAGILAWSIMYIALDSDITALFFWYCIGRIQKNKIDMEKPNCEWTMR